MTSEVVIGTDDEAQFPKRFKLVLDVEGTPFSLNGSNESRTEVVLGSSSMPADRDLANHKASEEEEEQEVGNHTIDPVPIADMAFHMCHLRQVILLAAPQPALQEERLVYPFAVIEASETERVERIDDLLDTILYWAMEESTTFLDLPSQLAEVEAPEVLAFCLFCQRPRLVIKALLIMKHMLEHPQTASELCRTITGYYRFYCHEKNVCHPIRTAHVCRTGAVESKEGDEPKSSSRSSSASACTTCTASSSFNNLLFVLVFLLEHYTGLPDLLASAIDILTSLCLWKRVDAEVVLQSGLISVVATGMLTHVDNPKVRVSSTAFFSYVVCLSRGPSTSEDVPLSALVCYADGLLSIIMQTFTLGWSNSEIKASCLRFLRACSAFPPNRLPLVNEKALVWALRAVSDSLQPATAAKQLEDGLDILLQLSCYMDDFQCAYALQYCLTPILRNRGEISVLRRAVLFFTFLLKQFMEHLEKEHSDVVPSATSHVHPLVQPASRNGGRTPPSASLLERDSPPLFSDVPPKPAASSSHLRCSEVMWHSPLWEGKKQVELPLKECCQSPFSNTPSSSPSESCRSSCSALISLVESCSIPLFLIHLADFCFRPSRAPIFSSSYSIDSCSSSSSTSTLTSLEHWEKPEQKDEKEVDNEENNTELTGNDDAYLSDGKGPSKIDKEKALITRAVETEMRGKEQELATLARASLQLIWTLKEKALSE